MEQRLRLPASSVRGTINAWLETQAHLMAPPVLEVGSRLPGPAPWADFRWLTGDGRVGLDFEPGQGVDVVADAHQMPFQKAAFASVLCAETLEHVEDPQRVLVEIRRVLRPAGWALVTTLFCFPVHNYPADYWRFTPQGLRLLAGRAGFSHCWSQQGGEVEFLLNDHGEPVWHHFREPRHVFMAVQA